MDTIIAVIDSEISRLQEVRALLSKGAGAASFNVNGRKSTVKERAKRVLSPEARARIAAAQKKRWAAAKKASK